MNQEKKNIPGLCEQEELPGDNTGIPLCPGLSGLSQKHIPELRGIWGSGSTGGKAGKQGNSKGMVSAPRGKENTATVAIKGWAGIRGGSLHVPGGQERRNWSEKH